MEIRIKTAEEFRDAHVTIEIRAADQAEAELVAGGYPSELDWAAVRAERDEARRRVIELGEELEDSLRRQLAEQHQRAEKNEAYETAEDESTEALRRRNAELTAELETERQRAAEFAQERHPDRGRAEAAESEASEARRRVIELGEELETERERATENRDWAERAEGRLASAGLKLAEAQAAIERLATQIGKISGAVHSPTLKVALRRTYEAWEPRTMVEAIRQVRDVLGSPPLPSSPAEPTSQA